MDSFEKPEPLASSRVLNADIPREEEEPSVQGATGVSRSVVRLTQTAAI